MLNGLKLTGKCNISKITLYEIVIYIMDKKRRRKVVYRYNFKRRHS